MLIDINNMPNTIVLGRAGENEYTAIEFDVSSWLADYPGATISVVFYRPDGELYPVIVNATTELIAWWPTATDLAVSGDGRLELRLYSGDIIGKTAIVNTYTEESLQDEGLPPEIEPEWLDGVLSAGTSAKASAAAAAQSEENAAESEQVTTQAMADTLAMLGTDIPVMVDGKILIDNIPATATQEIYVVTSADELTSLNAQRGDLAELVEDIDGIPTITKTWQLLGNDPTVAANWVVWGASYAVQAGNATTANNAANAAMINNHRLVEMTESQFAVAVKDPDTYYLVYPDQEE